MYVYINKNILCSLVHVPLYDAPIVMSFSPSHYNHHQNFPNIPSDISL